MEIFKWLIESDLIMIFRVVAIKELFWNNYSIDLLFFGLTEEQVREILHEYKLVALELYEYKKEKVESYWIIKILIDFNWQEIKLLSKSDDMNWLIYTLSIIWIDVKNINFVDDNKKLQQEEINQIIENEKKKASTRIQEQKDIILAKEKKDEEIFDDQKLEKTLKLVQEFLEKVPSFLEKAKGTIPPNELKGLYEQWQELSKLKMWSNTEKMSSFLESAYNNLEKLEQEYLEIQESPNIDVEWSNVSGSYLLAEINKMEKAKSLSKLWWAKTWEDALYASLWWLFLYFKLIKKDLIGNTKDFPKYFPQIFWYLTLLASCFILFSTLYFCINKHSENINDFVFIIMIYSWIFWLVFYLINFIKKDKVLHNVLLLIFWSAISLVWIIILKHNFIF